MKNPAVTLIRVNVWCTDYLGGAELAIELSQLVAHQRNLHIIGTFEQTHRGHPLYYTIHQGSLN